MAIDDKTNESIAALRTSAEEYYEANDYQSALVALEEGLALLPLPITCTEESTWLYIGIGDCHFNLGAYKKSANAFYQSLSCPNGFGNPFPNLRMGQCLYEMGKIEESREYLERAFMLKGGEIFDGEDKKYFEHLDFSLKVA